MVKRKTPSKKKAYKSSHKHNVVDISISLIFEYKTNHHHLLCYHVFVEPYIIIYYVNILKILSLK